MTERRNRGKLWKPEDDALLRLLVAARDPPGVLARKLGRTQDSIRGRAAQLGIMLPSAMRPWKINCPRGPRSRRVKPGKAAAAEREDDV